jgi:hypothetical protein
MTFAPNTLNKSKTTAQIQSDAYAYISTQLNAIINANAILNDPNASTKFASAYITAQQTAMQTAITNIMAFAAWFMNKYNIQLPTAWTDAQVLANTGVLS